MDEQQAKSLGKLLRKQRQKLGLGTHLLSRKTGVGQTTIVRIELGEFLNPDPQKLRTLAEALGLDSAAVLAKAGYPVPTELLTPSTYLRAKYRDLPSNQLEALQADVAAVLRRHGINPHDQPELGEDEAPEIKTQHPRRKSTKSKEGRDLK